VSQGAVQAFAGAVAEGTVRLDRSSSLDELVDSISGLDGLGRGAAHYLALRLGEPDAWPIHDLSLVRRFPNTAGNPDGAVVRLTERWRPWRALAAAHLWLADGWSRLPTAGRGPARPDLRQPTMQLRRRQATPTLESKGRTSRG
jgi:3-methyladenine DNA glycosylase/8-oxoguanine DNA glycosylase